MLVPLVVFPDEVVLLKTLDKSAMQAGDAWKIRDETYKQFEIDVQKEIAKLGLNMYPKNDPKVYRAALKVFSDATNISGPMLCRQVFK